MNGNWYICISIQQKEAINLKELQQENSKPCRLFQTVAAANNGALLDTARSIFKPGHDTFQNYNSAGIDSFSSKFYAGYSLKIQTAKYFPVKFQNFEPCDTNMTNFRD